MTDLQEVSLPKPLYFSLAGLIYVVLGLGLTFFIHHGIHAGWISLKVGFPFTSMAIGGAVGFFVYLLIFVLGVSFAKHGMMHVLVDVIWQMLEQALGGLAVSLGIIYDMRQSYLEAEKAN